MNIGGWSAAVIALAGAVTAGGLLLPSLSGQKTVSSAGNSNFTGNETTEDAPAADRWRDDMALQLTALKQQLKAISQENHQLQQQLQQLQTAGEQQPPPVEPQPPAPDTSEAEAAETANLIDTINQTFTRETRDDAWAGDAETSIYQFFETEDIEASDLVWAECRATLCSLSSTHASMEAQDRFIEHFPQQLDLGGAGFFSTGVDEFGELYTTVFIARDGYALPQYSSEQ